MTQNRKAVIGVDGDRVDLVRVGDLGREVAQFAIDAHGDDGSVGKQAEPIGHCGNSFDE